MQVEPVHQLALALSSSPRLFACVLGSGVSRTAGICTGWEIVLDFVAKHAAQIGEAEAAAKDPAAWYVQKYRGEPDYSNVVARLAPTTDLRRNLLEPYFTVLDKVTGERREHEPTAAHRSIARLVQRGLVRVIVTTNFDRLMENALRDAGVASIEVVSSEEEALNCYPFHACECFVFKVHGDWKDTRLRNSNAELAAYPRGIAKLTRRIASEHGLIVCGWSAEYDVALRSAIASETRRFPLFWADPKLGGQAQKLVTQLRGTHVAATGDEFFSELELAVEALARQRPPAPLTGDVLVLKAKRLIAERRKMELDDLVVEATRTLCAWIEYEFEPVFDPSLPRDGDKVFYRDYLTRCEQHTEPLARLLVTLGRYRASSELAQRALSELLRIADRKASAPHYFAWTWLYSYPALLCAYAFGVACGHRDDWHSAIVAARDAGSGAVERELRLPPGKQSNFYTLARDDTQGPAWLLQWTNRIADWLFGLTSDWIARRADFEPAFDRFDVLLCALSLHSGRDEWKPRCSESRFVNKGATARATFDDVVEYWLINRVASSRPPGDEPLCGVFAGSGLDDNKIYERLRAWNPEKPTTSSSS